MDYVLPHAVGPAAHEVRGAIVPIGDDSNESRDVRQTMFTPREFAHRLKNRNFFYEFLRKNYFKASKNLGGWVDCYLTV